MGRTIYRMTNTEEVLHALGRLQPDETMTLAQLIKATGLRPQAVGGTVAVLCQKEKVERVKGTGAQDDGFRLATKRSP